MKKLFLSAMLLAACSVASATNNGNDTNCNGNSSCAQTTNYNNTPTYNNTPSYNQTANGGAGGAGGAGGHATVGNVSATSGSNTNNIGTASGIGSKSFSPESNASSNSTNLNTNTAQGGSVVGSGNSANSNKNVQGQAQGQKQSQSVSNSGNSSIASGAVVVSVNTAPSSEQTRDAADATVQAAKLQADAIRYASEQKIYNTPSVNGPALTSSNDTCMGSSSGSVNIPGLGIGGGTTWVDNNCRMLKNSRELWNMGMKAAAMALMCTDAGNKEALELTGFKCPQSKRDEESRAAMDKANLYNGNDPIVRARLGMSIVDGSGKAVVSGDGKALKSAN